MHPDYGVFDDSSWIGRQCISGFGSRNPYRVVFPEGSNQHAWFGQIFDNEVRYEKERPLRLNRRPKSFEHRPPFSGRNSPASSYSVGHDLKMQHDFLTEMMPQQHPHFEPSRRKASPYRQCDRRPGSTRIAACGVNRFGNSPHKVFEKSNFSRQVFHAGSFLIVVHFGNTFSDTWISVTGTPRVVFTGSVLLTWKANGQPRYEG